MAMHALAEGYLIKGDFGQAEWGGDKLRILRFFPFFFLLKKMDESNKPELFLKKKYVILHVFVFCDLCFFSLEKYKKETNKQLDFEKRLGIYLSSLILFEFLNLY